MLLHGVVESIATTGTGTITVPGTGGFNRYAVNDLMDYVLEDANGNREWGIGTVQASSTLARTEITGTLISGTYTAAGSAISLSGSATLRCVEHEGTVKPVYRRTLKGAILGASRGNRNNNTTSGTNIRALPIGAFNWWRCLTGNVVEIVSYDAVGGQGIDAVENKLATEVFPYFDKNGGFAIVSGDAVGNSTNGSMSVNDAMIILRRICDKLIARNIRPIVTTCSPNVQLTAANDASFAKGDRYHQSNREIIKLAQSDSRIGLWRWDNTSTDYSEANGRPITTSGTGAATTAWTSDGTHDQPRLSIRDGQGLIPVMAPLIAGLSNPWPTSNSDPDRALANSLNYGTGGTLAGGATGTVSANCTLTGSGTTTGSKIARSDLGHNGEMQKIVVSGATGNVTFQYTGRGSVPAVMTPGTTPVIAMVEIILNATPTNLRGFKPILAFTGAATSFVGFDTASSGGFASYADAGAYIPQGTVLTYFTPVFTLPSGVTDMRIQVEATKAAAGNMDIDFTLGRAHVFPRSALPFMVSDPTVP